MNRFLSPAVVAAALAVTGCAAERPAREEPLVGTWKAVSVKREGREISNGGGYLAVGSVWKFRRNGTGSLEDTAIPKWTYDPVEMELETYRPDFFGSGMTKLWTAGVKWKGKNVVIAFNLLGRWEVELQREE